MSGHTPGPWRVVPRGSSNDWDIEGANGEDMSGMLRGMLYREVDARLMAAAPDLLEAAKWMLEAGFDGDPKRATADNVMWAGEALRGAVAKAEGRPS